MVVNKHAIGVCNPAYSCACPKPGQTGRVVAGTKGIWNKIWG